MAGRTLVLKSWWALAMVFGDLIRADETWPAANVCGGDDGTRTHDPLLASMIGSGSHLALVGKTGAQGQFLLAATTAH